MMRIIEAFKQLVSLRQDIDDLKVLAAQPLVRDVRSGRAFASLADAEFKVFSQFGDDGIIQYLIHRLRPLPDSFIEFGVENYREANTRFLLLNDNWRGLVMDASERAAAQIRAERIHWRHTLAVRQSFITRENINGLIKGSGFSGEIGLLSVDIDGNDYWVWKDIHVVNPVIVIVEYNAVFGPDLAVTVPYDASFARHRAHHSALFWGASLSAFARLAGERGYSLVGCNSGGNNAYFIRDDRVGTLPVLAPRDAFVDARFRESRDESGRLTYLTGADRLKAIAHMQVHDIRQDKIVPLSSLTGA